ncbi:hypothetical protein Metbo_1608 [Methanobacterium lacus]|uniref:SbsA Ig-like domain-containing protein n=1 Tax=Methanobacterium lacus (strain AL-21) TaxID=877455 RepID=F0T984_METLA|nr:Ig-like domain-containing protein [Methanobacterium lacus]ADZ09835.1 hypothetical protein Metbo_1608 [Methanobacterium lacus]
MGIDGVNTSLLGLICFGIFLMILSCAGTANAAETPTIYVNCHGNDSWNGLAASYNSTTHNGPKATLKNAVATVKNNGTIEVASGCYRENGIYINQDITIQGHTNTVVDGFNSDRIFTVDKGANLTLINMIMVNGKSINGGAIYNEGTLNVFNCSITNCKAVNGDGGAIYNLGYLNVSMSRLNNNQAANGGAIYCYFGYNSFVNYNQITNNQPLAGEIYCPFGVVDANFNWWGSNTDPSDLVNYGVNTTSWMVMLMKVDRTTIGEGCSLNVTVDMVHDNFNNYHDPLNGHLPDGMPVLFNSTLGIIQPSVNTKNGLCTTTLKSGAVSGTALITSFMDSQVLNTTIKINVTPKVQSQTPPNKSHFKGKIKTLTLQLSEAVQAGPNYGGISLKGPTGNVPITTNIFDNIVTVTGAFYLPDGNYKLYLPFNSLMDVSNNCMNQSFYSNFTVDNRVPKLTVTPVSGYYNGTKTVTIKMDEIGTIYYTLDNSTPTNLSKKYIGPFKLVKTTIIRYLGVDLAGNTSTGKATYTIDKNPPTIKYTSPKMMNTHVSTRSNLEIYFNEAIFRGINFNNIRVTNMGTGKPVPTYKTLNGNALILQNKKAGHTWYSIIIPRGSVKDKVGNQFKSNYILRFKTV